MSRLIICDTTGGAGPEEVTEVIGGLSKAYPGAKFGFHGHTDRGLGVANTRAAIFAGASQVQGTLVGTGERRGNVNLTTVIGSMQLRGEAEFVAPESLTGLTNLAHSTYAAFGLDTPHGAAIVGPALSARGPACMAVANEKTREPICGAIRPMPAPIP